MAQNGDQNDDANASHPRQRRQVVRASWEGPIPPPALIEQYNAIIPNGAERIMRMAEKAQDADIEMHRGWLKTNARGQRLGAAISIIALVLAASLSAFALYMSAPVAFYALPAALLSVPVFSVIKALISGPDNN